MQPEAWDVFDAREKLWYAEYIINLRRALRRPGSIP